MIDIEVYDNRKLLERYTIIVMNRGNRESSYGITIADDPDEHTYLHPIDECGVSGTKITLPELPLEQRKVVFGFLADDLARGRIKAHDIPESILESVFAIVTSDRYPPIGEALGDP